MADYYAYVHARPESVDATGIFYVGKGKGRRSHSLVNRSNYHQHIIDKYGAKNILIGKLDCSSEAAAFELEKGLIKCLRYMGITLANATDGGEGTSGLIHSDATKRKLSISIAEARKSPALRKHHSEAMKLHYTSPEARRVTGEASRKAQNTPEALVRRSDISKRVALQLGSAHYKMMSSKVDRVALAAKMVEVNARPEKIEKQRATITKTLNEPAFKVAHALKMKEVGATQEFRVATAIGTKAAVNKEGVQDKRRVYLKLKYAYIKAHNLPRYHRGATKDVVLAWANEVEKSNG